MTTTVVGVDGSPDSDLAVEWAAADAARRHRPLHIVHAYLSPFVAAQVAVPTSGGFEPVLRAAAEGTLGAAVARASSVAAGLDITTDMPAGEAPAALLDAARRAALLVVGCGHAAMAGLLPGSVSRAAVHHAACSVAVVK
ncbi:universal stress protein [Dactylosporangium sp. NBC_01737]|uniref:universal stress protein n=1 Tax=Dactylosporangium sp. NBC_01737 TaxID=2975959 RepID=UPI002E0DEF5B|nr:universal stress protein [Dactylosporangium sp. NBC_01737]